MKIKFVKAEKKDVELIYGLADKIWKKHYPDIVSMQQIEYMLSKMYSPESLLDQMKEGHDFTLVYVDDEPLGYISISKKSDNHYSLHKFYIDVASHGKGIGSKLFEHIVSNLPQKSTIELTVNRQNFKAINFYFKHGFVISHVANFDIGNGYVMNDFVMKRK